MRRSILHHILMCVITLIIWPTIAIVSLICSLLVGGVVMFLGALVWSLLK